MSLTIRVVTSDDDERWDRFVAAHPNGSIYHLSAWRRVLQGTYRYRPLYLALEAGSCGDLQGAFPVMLVQSRFTGDRLVSLPFTAFCPPLVPDSFLTDMLCFQLTRYPDIEYLEMKSREVVKDVPEFLVPQSRYMTHVVDLSGGEEALLQSFHATSVRQRIRKALKSNFQLRMAQNEEDLRGFYRLHITTRKKHGLPPHPFRFFRVMWRELAPGNLLCVPLLVHNGEAVAGAIALKYKDTFSLEYSAADEEYLSLGANQLLTWEVIKMACAEGARYFDFGRTSVTNRNLIEYKERWGAKSEALSYYYYPKVDKLGAEGSLGRRLLNCANRLLPKSLLQVEGELVYPHLG